MKKWVTIALAAATFSLAACGDEEVVSNNEKVVNEKEVVEVEPEPKIDQNLRALHYQQYYNVLNIAIEELGFGIQTGTYDDNTSVTGVYYAELIDFDRDGYEELYVLMKNDGIKHGGFGHRRVKNYVHEVWTPNREGDLPVLGYYGEIPAEQCTVCDMSVSFIEGENETFLVESSHRMTEGQVSNDYKFMKRETHISQLRKTTFGEYGIERYFNDTLVEKSVFENEMAKFSGNERPIIISNAGEKSYGFDKVGTSAILPLIEKLTGKPYEGFESVESVQLAPEQPAEKRELQNIIIEALYNHTGRPQMDGILSYYTAEEMVQIVKNDSGYELDLNNLPFAGKEAASLKEPITYENGIFYLYPR